MSYQLEVPFRRGQCYALAPHPAIGGPNPANGERVDPRLVKYMDI